MSVYAHYFASSPARLRIEEAGLQKQYELDAVRNAKAELEVEAELLAASCFNELKEDWQRAIAPFLRKRLRDQEKARSPRKRIISEVLASRGISRTRWERQYYKHYPDITHAKHEIYFLMQTELGLSTLKIGRRMGFHHSTILYGIRQHKAREEAKTAA